MVNRSDMLRFRVARSAWIDTAVLAGLLVLLNGFLAPADFGWLQLDPSPYLLLPVLIGCRYGFLSGVLAGVTGMAIVSVGLVRLESITFAEALQEHGFFLGALIFIGGVCGEIQHSFRKRELQASVENENLHARLKKLDTDLFLLREAKAELERLMATRDAELSTLDSEIRRLFDSEGNELFENLLLLLNRQVRITDAGLYLLGDEDQLTRKALLGTGEFLPESIQANEIEMVAMALKHRTSVTIPEFWQKDIKVHKNYLLVAPLLDAAENPLGVLVVTGMPFIALNKKSVQLISLVCRWAARVVEIRSRADGSYRLVNGVESQKIFTADYFKQSLELAHTSFCHHSLPSSVVIFAAPKLPANRQGDLEQLVMATVRNGDFPAQTPIAVPHLAVLLPLAGERGAEIFRDRILLNCRRNSELGPQIEARTITFKPNQTFDQLWKEIITHEKAVALSA